MSPCGDRYIQHMSFSVMWFFFLRFKNRIVIRNEFPECTAFCHFPSFNLLNQFRCNDPRGLWKFNLKLLYRNYISGWFVRLAGNVCGIVSRWNWTKTMKILHFRINFLKCWNCLYDEITEHSCNISIKMNSHNCPRSKNQKEGRDIKNALPYYPTEAALDESNLYLNK